MGTSLVRGGLRPFIMGAVAVVVISGFQWPRELDGSGGTGSLVAELAARYREHAQSSPIARSPEARAEMLAAVADAAGTTVPAEAPHRATFAERFAAVFWPFGDEEEANLSDDRSVSVSPADESDLAPETMPPSTPREYRTAIYDISAHAVFLPSGERLEAHSGLGHRLDDPRYITAKNRGPTPPNVYDLVLRKGRFHGVQAIRLVPVDEDKMFGRDGMLAHSYMLGSSGQSNGCVVFRDYPAFLSAFQRGEVNRLVVVERREPGSTVTASVSTPLANRVKHKVRRAARSSRARYSSL